MAKIKVKQQRNGLGDVQYQNTKSTGVHAADIFSASEVENNPSKYEVVESTQTGKGILRESFPEHKLGRGWTKIKGWKPKAQIEAERERYAHSSVPRKEGLTESAPSPAAKLTEAEARKAVARAHRILGIDMPEKSEEDLLLEAWERLCGNPEAAKLAKEGKF